MRPILKFNKSQDGSLLKFNSDKQNSSRSESRHEEIKDYNRLAVYEPEN